MDVLDGVGERGDIVREGFGGTAVLTGVSGGLRVEDGGIEAPRELADGIFERSWLVFEIGIPRSIGKLRDAF